ncbi:MAG: hypothetical protein R6X25_14310 [Candidatus Krumholzibacteriia bacterium]
MSYWQTLQRAREALDGHDFTGAEQSFFAACRERDAAPARVFFTERLPNGFAGMVERVAGRAAGDRVGRWDRFATGFRQSYAAAAETAVRAALRSADLRPEENAELQQPRLETALFLTSSSRLFPPEPTSAVVLLRAVFRTAARTGKPVPPELVQPHLPLTEEDRLGIARDGDRLLASVDDRFAGVALGRALVSLLRREYFGASSERTGERAWWEARLVDGPVGDAASAATLYEDYLAVAAVDDPRRDEARIRLFELLANVTARHFPVPRYAAAEAALGRGPFAGEALAERAGRARAVVAHRRPQADTAQGWLSLASLPDDGLACVFWWDEEPRDLAVWDGCDCDLLAEFAAPAGVRVVAADATAAERLAAAGVRPFPAALVRDQAEALLEPWLGPAGLDERALERLLAPRTAGWRSGWNERCGVAELRPPSPGEVPVPVPHGLPAALRAGLLWLACRDRLRAADAVVRAGLGELARRGHGPAAVLYEFVVLGDETARALDVAWQPWTLPLLWTRPEPAWPGPAVAPSVAARPDLAASRVTVVEGGEPAAVLAGWGPQERRWRVVVDGPARLPDLAAVAARAAGPVTLLPPGGRVHALDRALGLLEDLGRRDEGDDALLAVVHWLRLVETHNGDLMDHARLRPRPSGVLPLQDRYGELVRTLPRVAPCADPQTASDPWAAQYAQRARRSGLVVGTAAELPDGEADLAASWGVHPGADAAWVFHDAASVHARLLARGRRPLQVHRRLAAHGSRQLSLVRGPAVLATERQALLGRWLAPHGRVDVFVLDPPAAPAPPELRLATTGLAPVASSDPVGALAARLVLACELLREDPGRDVLVLLGAGGDLHEDPRLWIEIAAGAVEGAGRLRPVTWADLMSTPPGGAPPAVLLVPSLQSLQEGSPLAAESAVAPDAHGRPAGPLRARQESAGLELAVLAAFDLPVVVADPRWWWLQRPSAWRDALGWSAERALARGTGRMARNVSLFPLPAQDDERRIGDLRRRVAVKPGAAATQALRSPPAPAPGLVLRVGDPESELERLQTWVRACRDRGELDRWLLVIADEPPAGLDEFAADRRRFPVAGTSRLAPGPSGAWSGARILSTGDEARHGDEGIRADDISAPAAVVLGRPADLARPGVAARLEGWPPAAIVAADLADWLPGSGRAATMHARALHAILATTTAVRRVYASRLPAAWRPFLEEALAASGGRTDPAAPAAVQEFPAGPPQVESRLAAGASRSPGPEEWTSGEGGPGAANLPSAPPGTARRVLRLLAAGGAVWPHGEDPGFTGGPYLVPTPWLEHQTGVPAAAVRESLRVVRWVAALRGTGGGADPAETAAVPTVLDRCLHHAAIEAQVARLEDVLIPLATMLENAVPPGVAGTWSLEEALLARAPLAGEPEETAAVLLRDLVLCDALLAFWSARTGSDLGLDYRAELGALFGGARRIRWRGERGELAERLRGRLRRLVRDARDLLLEASGTAGRLQVVVRPDSAAPDVLAAGALLGWWGWSGSPGDDGEPLVDLVRLAEARRSGKAGDLHALLVRAVGEEDTDPAVEAGGEKIAALLDEGEDGVGSLLGGLLRRGRADDDLREAAMRVLDCADPAAAGSRQLVLTGSAGAGRLRALVAGLAAARTRGLPAAAVSVHCPDLPTAARVQRELRRVWPDAPPPVQLSTAAATRSGSATDDDEEAASGAAADARAAALRADLVRDPGLSVRVLVELQRFPAEVRYALAAEARTSRLLASVDPGETRESWENLFLTAPRPGEVVPLERQRLQARRPWEAVRRLAPHGEVARHGSLRRERGDVVARPAGNLDECVACVVEARSAGRLGNRTVVAASLAEDLAYLGRSLVSHGWLAVYLEELEELLLPGALELLAILADLAAAAARRPGRDEDLPTAGERRHESTAVGSPEPLLPSWLAGTDRPAYARWLRDTGAAAGSPLAELLPALFGTSWAADLFARPEARARAAALAGAMPAETAARLFERPVGQAWLRTVRGWRGEPEPAEPPLVLLTGTGRAQGDFQADGVYLCAGSEPPAEHARVLGRMADRVLILYQDRSPLPGEDASV